MSKYIIYLYVLLLPFAFYLSHEFLKMMGSKLCVWKNSQFEATYWQQWSTNMCKAVQLIQLDVKIHIIIIMTLNDNSYSTLRKFSCSECHKYCIVKKI